MTNMPTWADPETDVTFPDVADDEAQDQDISVLKHQRDVLQQQIAALDPDDENGYALLELQLRSLNDRIAKAEIAAAQAEIVASNYQVEYAGRMFTINKPLVSDITALVRFIGHYGTRSGNKVAKTLGRYLTTFVKGKPVASIPVEQYIFGFAEDFEDRDWIDLSIILLFGGSNAAKQEGEQWFARLTPDQIAIDPVLQALAYRVAQSEDLRKALKRLPLVQAAFQL